MNNRVVHDPPIQLQGLYQNRNFMFFFAGRFISKLGDSIYLFALTWYVFEKYSSPMLAGIMMMLGTIPTVVLGPFAGVIADKMDRKKIIVWMEFVQATVVFTVVLLDYAQALNIWLLFGVVTILDICNTLFNPASMAIIPTIVQGEELAKANSIDSMNNNISSILGILGGGLLYSAMGFATLSLINAISFGVAGVLEMMLVLPSSNKQGAKREASKEGLTLITGDLREGYRFLRSQNGLFMLFVFVTVFNFLFAPFYSIYLPFMLNKLLKAASTHLSYIQASYAFGAIVGAIGVMWKLQNKPMIHVVITGLWLSNFLLVGMAMPVLPCLQGKTEAGLVTLYLIGLLFLIGITASLVSIPVGVIFQRQVPNAMLGRVIALFGSISSTALPLGYLVGGILAERAPLYLLILVTVLVLLLLTGLMERNRLIDQLS